MTTPSTSRKAGPLLGTGSQTTWPFTFKVFAATDIAVTIADSLGVETALVYGVDFNVTLNGNQETSPGGTVTYPISGAALPVGKRLVIIGNLPYDQPLDLPSGGNFSPLALENQLDRTVMQIQQLRENVGRALQLPVTAAGTLSVQLPQPAPNELIGWDSGGNNLANIPLSDIGTAIAFGTYRYDTFTGNGTTTSFALSEDPAVLANLDVSISGVVQVPGTDYSLLTGNLVFASAPSNGTTILARYGQALVSLPDSDQITFVQAGAGATTRTVQNKLRESVSVLDFGAVGDGVTDDTAAIQTAIDAAWVNHALLIFPTGNYLVTDTLDVYEGTQIQGETKFQYTKGYGRPPKATSIFFQPTAPNTDLFVYSWKSASPPGFIFHTAIEGLYLETSTSNARYGISLNGVIYGRFGDMGFQGPWNASIYCYGTINNRFENIYARGNYCAVVYAGEQETTDVWDQCSFWGSPVGVRFEGAAVGVRFTGCLWEQIEYYGVDVHSKCQSIMVTDGYCEDVPFGATPAADSCMFRVGLHTGSSLADINNHMIVTGGVFNGRNGGAAGQLFNVGACWGVIVNGITASRWPALFSTDPTNTKPNSIVVNGIQGISWGGTIDDSTKWTGITPNGVLNTGSFDVNYAGGAASFAATTTTTLTNSQVVPGAAWYPNTDGVALLGLSNQRWNTIYATNGTINTSDAKEKQDIVAISDAEKRVALRIKGMLKRYRFKDAFSQKGDGARYHFGAIAQEVAQAFADEGLDASRYGLFCSDTWYTVDGQWVKEVTADKKYIEKKYFAGDIELTFEGDAQIPEGVRIVETLHDTEEHTRLGLRYDELLVFVLASI